MFRELHSKTKILVVTVFTVACVVTSLIISLAIDSMFPKNISFNKENIFEKNVYAQKKPEEEPQAQPPVQEVETKPVPKVKSDKLSEIYTVGVDIDEGAYKLNATDVPSYYRIKDKNGNEDMVYFNFTYVNLEVGQILEVVNSDIISESEITPYQDSSYIDGQYKVGFDIKAGTYNIKSKSSMGKVEISTSPSIKDVILTEFVENPSTITIRDGQYLTISNVEFF